MANTAVNPTRRILELEHQKEVVEKALSAAMGIGSVALGSKIAMKHAVFGQLYRQVVTPGVDVPVRERNNISRVLGIASVREFNALEREFKADNPRCDSTAASFVAGARKQPAITARKTAIQSLEKSTLVTARTTAVKVAKMTKAAHDLATDGLKRSDRRFDEKEAIKYMTGAMLKAGTPNKKMKKSSFLGQAQKRKRNDTP